MTSWLNFQNFCLYDVKIKFFDFRLYSVIVKFFVFCLYDVIAKFFNFSSWWRHNLIFQRKDSLRRMRSVWFNVTPNCSNFLQVQLQFREHDSKTSHTPLFSAHLRDSLSSSFNPLSSLAYRNFVFCQTNLWRHSDVYLQQNGDPLFFRWIFSITILTPTLLPTGQF